MLDRTHSAHNAGYGTQVDGARTNLADGIAVDEARVELKQKLGDLATRKETLVTVAMKTQGLNRAEALDRIEQALQEARIHTHACTR